MVARVLAASLALTALAAAVSACRSSGRYGSPAYAAANVGVGAVGAAASRAAGGCLAMCVNGTHCNRATGLCEPGYGTATVPAPAKQRGRSGSAALSTNASYEPGHEYVVPPLPGDDAGCAPPASGAEHGDGGLACEMDAGAGTY